MWSHGGRVQEFEPSEHPEQVASSLPFINSTVATTMQKMINTSCTRQNTTRSLGCELHHSAARDLIEWAWAAPLQQAAPKDMMRR